MVEEVEVVEEAVEVVEVEEVEEVQGKKTEARFALVYKKPRQEKHKREKYKGE
jgi:hypothetical protein